MRISDSRAVVDDVFGTWMTSDLRDGDQSILRQRPEELVAVLGGHKVAPGGRGHADLHQNEGGAARSPPEPQERRLVRRQLAPDVGSRPPRDRLQLDDEPPAPGYAARDGG